MIDYVLVNVQNNPFSKHEMATYHVLEVEHFQTIAMAVGSKKATCELVREDYYHNEVVNYHVRAIPS